MMILRNISQSKKMKTHIAFMITRIRIMSATQSKNPMS